MASYFKGWSISQIMDIDISDFMGLSRSGVRQAVSRLASAANKRIQRLIKANIETPALYEAKESGGKFSTKGKDINELRAEFIRVKDFLVSPSSTVTGAKALRNDIREGLELRGISINNEDFNKLFNMYMDLRGSNPDIVARTLKYKLLRNIEINIDSNDNSTVDELTKRIVNALESIYNPGGPQYEGTANFFEFE